jgi:formylglycine-generating enzyme required for sulfatase activity
VNGFDHDHFAELARGRLVAELAQKRGHCTAIGFAYWEADGIRASLASRGPTSWSTSTRCSVRWARPVPGEGHGCRRLAGHVPGSIVPPNGYGLYETTGNVWEWCADWYDAAYDGRAPRRAPTGPKRGQSRVMRGGSYLCHASYCHRYRVDARSGNTPDTAGNIGFRVAADR